MSHHRPKRLREIADFIVEALVTSLRQQEHIMTAQSNFDAALADLDAKLTAHDAAVQLVLADLKAAFAADDSVAFQAAADKLSAMSAKLAQETADLKAADAEKPADPPPAPAPAPQSPDTAPAPVAPVASAPSPEPAPAPAPDPAAPTA